jgi:hypothetical protein
MLTYLLATEFSFKAFYYSAEYMSIHLKYPTWRNIYVHMYVQYRVHIHRYSRVHICTVRHPWPFIYVIMNAPTGRIGYEATRNYNDWLKGAVSRVFALLLLKKQLIIMQIDTLTISLCVIRIHNWLFSVYIIWDRDSSVVKLGLLEGTVSWDFYLWFFHKIFSWPAISHLEVFRI